jgi:DNA-binding NarL/FixJ family response regulator
MTGNRAGRDHLEHRSRLKMRLAEMPPISNIMIIDDTTFDAEVLGSVLRLVFDPNVVVRHVRNVRDIRKAVMDEVPTLLFLDDRLGHGTSAEVSLNLIRTAGCQTRAIVMSGLLTRARHIELLRLGVADVIHKDDINVARVSEAILKVLDVPPAAAST